MEDTESEKKETTLFGGGFLEKAAKRLEEEKVLAKVIGARHGGSPLSKCQCPGQDPNDLRRCLEKGTPAMYSSRNPPAPAAIPTKEATQQRVEQTVASVEHIQFNMFNQYFNLYSTFITSSPYEPTPTLLVQLAEYNIRPIAAPGGKG